MTRPVKMLFVALILATGSLGTMYVGADAQVLTPRPEDLRFQVLLNEPLAEPNRRGVVAGTSALLVKDRLTGQCFVAVTIGNSMGLSPAACQP